MRHLASDAISYFGVMGGLAYEQILPRCKD